MTDELSLFAQEFAKLQHIELYHAVIHFPESVDPQIVVEVADVVAGFFGGRDPNMPIHRVGRGDNFKWYGASLFCGVRVHDLMPMYNGLARRGVIEALGHGEYETLTWRPKFWLADHWYPPVMHSPAYALAQIIHQGAREGTNRFIKPCETEIHYMAGHTTPGPHGIGFVQSHGKQVNFDVRTADGAKTMAAAAKFLKSISIFPENIFKTTAIALEVLANDKRSRPTVEALPPPGIATAADDEVRRRKELDNEGAACGIKGKDLTLWVYLKMHPLASNREGAENSLVKSPTTVATKREKWKLPPSPHDRDETETRRRSSQDRGRRVRPEDLRHTD